MLHTMKNARTFAGIFYDLYLSTLHCVQDGAPDCILNASV